MSHLSTTQKVLIALSLIAFLAFNIYSIFLTFPDLADRLNILDKTSKLIIVKNKESLQDEYAIGEYDEGEMVTVEKGIVEAEIGDIATLIANAPVSFTFSNGTLSINSGVIFVEAKKDFNLKVDLGYLYLTPGNSGVYNSESSIFFITNGEIQLANNSSSQEGEYLAWEVDAFKNYIYEKQIFNEEYIYTALRKTLDDLAYLPAFIDDINPPDIELISPVDGQEVQDVQIKVIFSTEPNIDVSINSLKTTSDSIGNVESMVFLDYGENKIEITATDSSGNRNEVVFTLYRSRLATDYPQSYPVSYSIE